jgi:hypothetical protein
MKTRENEVFWKGDEFEFFGGGLVGLFLKNGLDTDNWFPINPIDYKINPWIRLNSINDINTMGNELIKQFFNRVALLNNYTLYSPSNGLKSIDQYAKLESIAANKTVFSQKARNIISNVLLDIESQLNNPNSPVLTDGKFNLKNSNYYKNFILDSDIDYYEISEVNEFQKIGDFKISGKFSDEVDYVLFDESSIINNSKKLFQELLSNGEFQQQLSTFARGKIQQALAKDIGSAKTNLIKSMLREAGTKGILIFKIFSFFQFLQERNESWIG